MMHITKASANWLHWVPLKVCSIINFKTHIVSLESNCVVRGHLAIKMMHVMGFLYLHPKGKWLNSKLKLLLPSYPQKGWGKRDAYLSSHEFDFDVTKSFIDPICQDTWGQIIWHSQVIYYFFPNEKYYFFRIFLYSFNRIIW